MIAIWAEILRPCRQRKSNFIVAVSGVIYLNLWGARYSSCSFDKRYFGWLSFQGKTDTSILPICFWFILSCDIFITFTIWHPVCICHDARMSNLSDCGENQFPLLLYKRPDQPTTSLFLLDLISWKWISLRSALVSFHDNDLGCISIPFHTLCGLAYSLLFCRIIPRLPLLCPISRAWFFQKHKKNTKVWLIPLENMQSMETSKAYSWRT